MDTNDPGFDFMTLDDKLLSLAHEMIRFVAEERPEYTDADIQSALAQYGYNVKLSSVTIVTADLKRRAANAPCTTQGG